jgi:hypothetical protein
MGIAPGDKLVALYLADKKSVAFITAEQAQVFVTKMGERFTQLKQTLVEDVKE